MIRHDKLKWKSSYQETKKRNKNWGKHYFAISGFMRKSFQQTLLEAFKYFDCFLYWIWHSIATKYGLKMSSTESPFNFLKWFLKWTKRWWWELFFFRESHILALTLDLSRLSCQLIPLVSSNQGGFEGQGGTEFFYIDSRWGWGTNLRSCSLMTGFLNLLLVNVTFFL